LSKSELTDLLQAHMQEGLAELHSRVLTKAAKV
jgi:1-acyl-sn-glycerol-3-phosphate acyltransferase